MSIATGTQTAVPTWSPSHTASPNRAALERTVTTRGILATLTWRRSVRFDARPVQLVKGCCDDAVIRPLNSLQHKTPTRAKVAVLKLSPCNVNDMLQEVESVRRCWVNVKHQLISIQTVWWASARFAFQPELHPSCFWSPSESARSRGLCSSVTVHQAARWYHDKSPSSRCHCTDFFNTPFESVTCRCHWTELNDWV